VHDALSVSGGETRVTGIGGILFKAQDPVALNAWYANFRVERLDDFVVQLKSDGVKVVKDIENYDGIGRFASIEDPEGNRVEFWEPEEDA
jgi:predicted enzyme related to lactoylglutathione lyase